MSIRTRYKIDYTGKNSKSHTEFMAEKGQARSDVPFAGKFLPGFYRFVTAKNQGWM